MHGDETRAATQAAECHAARADGFTWASAIHRERPDETIATEDLLEVGHATDIVLGIPRACSRPGAIGRMERDLVVGAAAAGMCEAHAVCVPL